MRLRKTVLVALIAIFTPLLASCTDKAQPLLTSTDQVDTESAVDVSQVAVLEVQLILRDSERKLAGVNVDIQWDEAGMPSKTATRSNADGLVRLEFEHGAQIVAVHAKPSSYSAPDSVEAPMVMYGGQTQKIEMVLAPAASLFGMVYDAEGLPVEGANVVCYFYSPEFVDKQPQLNIDVFTTTDEQGRFALGGIPAGPFVIEAAFENQMSVWRPGGAISEGQRYDNLEVLIEPAHQIYGQVIDMDDNPIADAIVVAGKPNRRKNRKVTDNPLVFLYGPRAIVTRSDDKGMFALPAVPDSQGWNVNARHPDFAQSHAVVDAGQIDVWIEMAEAISLSGIVSDASGAPLSNVQVWLLTDDTNLSVGTDVDGRYKFSDLQSVEDVYAIAHHPQHGTALFGPIVFDGKSQQFDAQLQSEQSIKGRVVDAAGNPQSNVGVQIKGALPRDSFSSSRLPENFLGLDSTLTNSDGEFMFNNLYANTFVLSAYAPGVPAVFMPGVKIGDELEVIIGE